MMIAKGYRLILRIIIDEWERENGDGKDDKDDNNRNKDNKGILTYVEEWWSMNETKNDDWGKDWCRKTVRLIIDDWEYANQS